MNLIRKSLAALAFVFAIGVAFAFQPAELANTQPIQLKNGIDCPSALGPDDCTDTTVSTKCKVLGFEFVAEGMSCSTASLGRPI